MESIDFTGCPRVPGRAYNGANGKKIAVSIDGEVWMLKFPPSAADKPNDLPYSNSSISEHLGSAIFRLLGVPAQETRLGTHVNGRTINYRDFVAARSDPGLVEALNRLLPRIRLLDFDRLLAETPYLADLQHAFLLTYLNARRDRIFD